MVIKKIGFSLIVVFIAIVILNITIVFASTTDGTINTTNKYAWGENIGWLNFSTTEGDVHVTDSALSGYAWAENIGWIYLNDIDNDGEGNLSGYAWSENTGWIDFAPTYGGVTINSSGEFSGYAWGENIGWIVFGGFDNSVKTDWRPVSARATPTPTQGGGTWIGFLQSTTQPTQTVTPILPSSSVLPLPSIKPPIKSATGKIYDYLPKAVRNLLPNFLKPKEPEKPPEIPVEQLVDKIAPLSMSGKWNLLPPSAESFVLAPLPSEISQLAVKFPELEKTFKDVGISRMSDIEKLQTAKLILPGLSGSASLPISRLSLLEKKRIPTDFVFAKTAGELIDFKIVLSINDKGEPTQKMETVAGKPLILTIKPDIGVKSVHGYLVFKSRQAALDYQKKVAGKEKSDNFGNLVLNYGERPLVANALFGILPRQVAVLSTTQEKADKNSTDVVENRLILQQFEYSDPDGDGIYIAEINSPVVDGEYEIITVMDYLVDGKIVSKEVRMTAVIDPEGYIFEKNGDKETRVPGAIVSIFWLNTESKKYEIWPAKDFQQENPQITDVTGKYSFLVPSGNYYLSVAAPGYANYEGKPFEVKDDSGVHSNIELKSKDWWLKIFDWKTILLVIVILLLLYNFYRDKIRERKKI